MAKQVVKKGDTSRIEYIFIQDSSSTVGAGLTGLVFNSASLVASYNRTQGVRVAVTLATQTVTGAFSSGGFVEVDATNMPGLYRFDPPDAAFATGVDKTVFQLKGAANMAPVNLEYQLVDYDPEDAVRLGLTAMPNAAADAGGGLVISDAGGLDMDAVLSGNTPQTADHTAGIADIPTVAEFDARTLIAASYFDPAVDTVALVTLVNSLATNSVDALALNDDAVTEILTGVWNAARASFQVAGSFGESHAPILNGEAAAGTLSATQSTTNLTAFADDELIGRTIYFITGARAGEASDITDYENLNGRITYSAMTGAASASDRFVVH